MSDDVQHSPLYEIPLGESMLKKSCLVAIKALTPWLIPTLLFGHAGSLDINGGHYYGPSYHCHMSGCEMPDTFNIGRVGRDSLLTDYRDREKFFNEDDWSFEEDFDGDCQSLSLIHISEPTRPY